MVSPMAIDHVCQLYIKHDHIVFDLVCQVWVYSGRGSGQVRTKADEGRGQRAGQGISPAGVGDRLDSTTKGNER